MLAFLESVGGLGFAILGAALTAWPVLHRLRQRAPVWWVRPPPD